MSNTARLSDLRLRVRRMSDMVNSSFVEEDELTQYINDSLTDLYDIFVNQYEEYVVTKIDATLSGDGEYSITDDFGIDDFMKIIGIDLTTGSGSSRPITLQRYMFAERNTVNQMPIVSPITGSNLQYAVLGNTINFLNDNGSLGITIWYIPIFTPMIEADQIDDVMPFLAPGWEEYAVVSASIKCLQKEESNTKDLEIRLRRIANRIDGIAMNRDAGAPYRVIDVNRSQYASDWSYDV